MCFCAETLNAVLTGIKGRFQLTFKDDRTAIRRWTAKPVPAVEERRPQRDREAR
jgi:hypothetical protein